MAISIDDAAETAGAFLGQCIVLSDRERGAVELALRESRAAWASGDSKLQVSAQTVHKLALSLASALVSFRSAAQRAVGASQRDVLAQGGADSDDGLPSLTAAEHVLGALATLEHASRRGDGQSPWRLRLIPSVVASLGAGGVQNRARRACYVAVDAVWRRPALGPALAVACASAVAVALLGGTGLVDYASILGIIAPVATVAAAALAWRSDTDAAAQAGTLRFLTLPRHALSKSPRDMWRYLDVRPATAAGPERDVVAARAASLAGRAVAVAAAGLAASLPTAELSALASAYTRCVRLAAAACNAGVSALCPRGFPVPLPIGPLAQQQQQQAAGSTIKDGDGDEPLPAGVPIAWLLLTAAPPTRRRRPCFALGATLPWAYAHGGFMGAASLMLQRPRWAAALALVQPQVAQSCLDLCPPGPRASAPVDKLCLLLENSPVLAAFGTARTLAAPRQWRCMGGRSRAPVLEWDMFCPSAATARLAALRSAGGHGGDAWRRACVALAAGSVVAHGRLRTLVAEHVLRRDQCASLAATSPAQGGGRPVWAWLHAFACVLRDAAAAARGKSSSPDLATALAATPGEGAGARATVEDKAEAAAAAAAQALAEATAAFGTAGHASGRSAPPLFLTVVADIKTRAMPAWVAAALVEGLNTLGIVVAGVGAFAGRGEAPWAWQHLPERAGDASPGPQGRVQWVAGAALPAPLPIVFHHTLGDGQRAMRRRVAAGTAADGEALVCNAAGLLSVSQWTAEDLPGVAAGVRALHRLARAHGWVHWREGRQQWLDEAEQASVGEGAGDSGRRLARVVAELVALQAVSRTQLGAFTQEFDISPQQVDRLFMLLDTVPEVLGAGLVWGGLPDEEEDGIAEVGADHWFAADGAYLHRYIGWPLQVP